MAAPKPPFVRAAVWAVALLALSGIRAMADIIYVSADASDQGDGSSWDSAFAHLGSAIASSHPGDELWIAAGAYLPSSEDDPLNRQAAFDIDHALFLYGGFAGFESNRESRDPVANPTTLSADLLGDDGKGTPLATSENSYHVVRVELDAEASVVLDGLTITAGNANGNDEAGLGGGAIVTGGTVDFMNCIIHSNHAADAGGAVHAIDSAVTFDACELRHNSVEQLGGALYALGSELRFETSTLIENSSGGYGGGIYSTLGSLAMVRTSLTGNTAGTGGGIYSFLFSSLDMINCEFTGNVAEGAGGGAYAHDTDVRAQNCVFNGNVGSVGAGLYNLELLFYTATLSNCLFVHQQGEAKGGALKNVSGMLNVYNSIFWDNAPDDVYSDGIGESLTVQYCLLSSEFEGIGNLVGDPLLADPVGADGIPGTLDDDLWLTGTSPAIDAGKNGAVLKDFADLDADADFDEATPVDLSDSPRFVDDSLTDDTGAGDAPLVDIGPFEFQGEGLSCEGDANLDGTVDPLDLGFIAARLGCQVGSGDESCDASDQNTDGQVDPLDLGFVQARFGPCR